MRSDQQQAINRLAGTSATAFLCAVLCVYPLYIDKFSNLGVTKFTGCFTLFLLFLLWLVACTAIGARAPRPRNANVLSGLAVFMPYGNTAQFPPCGLSTAPAAAARHLRCQNAR